MKYLLVLGLVLLLTLSVTAEKDYTDFVNSLKQKIKESPFKHAAYDRLAYITDTYGPRMWGSVALEQVIYEMASMAKKEGFENVQLQPVKNFTKWVRGQESLTMLKPRPFPTSLNVIGLGGSVAGYLNCYLDLLRLKSLFSEIGQIWKRRKISSKAKSHALTINGSTTEILSHTELMAHRRLPSMVLLL